MGNTSSTPASPVKAQNRLSKPKTSSKSVTHLPIDRTPEHDSSKGSQHGMADEPVTWPIGGESRSESSMRRHLRRTLCDTRAHSDIPDGNGGDDGLDDLAQHVRDRLISLSRAGSTASNDPSSPASASAHSDVRTGTASPSSLLDMKDALGIVRSLSKSASPRDMDSLRKALGPEKAAKQQSTLPTKPDDELTKISSTALIRRRSLAVPGIATRETTPEYSQPAVEPLEEVALNGKVWKMEEFIPSPLTRLVGLDATRSETPTGLESSQLGGLELGSLRITNGAASPAPSALSRIMVANYSTGELQQDDTYFTASEGAASVESLAVDGEPQIPTQRAASEPKRRGARRHSNSVTRLDSPLKAEHAKLDSEKLDLRRKSPPKSISHPGPLRNSRTLSAQIFADHYIAEISIGPYAHITSKQSDAADSQLAQEARSTTTTNSKQSGPDDSQDKVKPERYYSRNQQNLDSGYSSGVSMFGSSDKGRVERDYFQPRQNQSKPVDALGVIMSPFSFEETFPAPSIVEENGLKCAEQATKSKASSPLLRKSKSWRFSAFGTPSMIPPNIPASDASGTFESKSPAMKKKLQKKRPESYQPVITSFKPIRDGSIPDIPDKLADTFERRLIASPGMDHLQHTFPSASHTDVLDDEEIPSFDNVAIEFPFFDPPKQEYKSKSEWRGDGPPTPPPHRCPPSLSSSTRNSDQAPSVDDTNAAIQDFGTVAESLGASPYDIATNSQHSRPSAMRTRTHPHQMGNATLRPKSMYSMTDKAAAEFARMRSLDRVAPDSRSRAKSRPRTEYAPNINVKQVLAGQSWRPQSMYNDVPPVPRIPAHQEYKVQPRPQPSVVPHIRSLMRQDSAHSSMEDETNASEFRSYAEWKQTQRSWSKRRRAIKEAMKLLEEQLEATKNPPKPPARNAPSPPKHRARPLSESSIRSSGSSTEVLCDRYGGGLRYGYEAGYGLGGSAGTRHKQSAASRKSAHVAYTYGVDLSDIPVFVQEMR